MNKDVEAWIKEKAGWFVLQCPGIMAWYAEDVKQFVENFLRANIQELRPKVSEKFVQEAIKYISEYPSYKRLEKKLIEAGVEVKKPRPSMRDPIKKMR